MTDIPSDIWNLVLVMLPVALVLGFLSGLLRIPAETYNKTNRLRDRIFEGMFLAFLIWAGASLWALVWSKIILIMDCL